MQSTCDGTLIHDSHSEVNSLSFICDQINTTSMLTTIRKKREENYLRPDQYDNDDIYACMFRRSVLLISRNIYYNCKKSA
jgi:hypothetical protein